MLGRFATMTLAAAALLDGIARAAPGEGSSRREINVFPLVGGDSYVGIGIGELGDWARIEPGADRYRWRLESGAFNTFKLVEGQGVITAYQDFYLLYTRK